LGFEGLNEQHSVDIGNYIKRDKAGLDAKSDRAGWLPAVSYCSALLCSALRQTKTFMQYSRTDACICIYEVCERDVDY
jgi:hypothetical protein